MDTVQIKKEAIQVTINLFKGKYNVTPNANKLLAFLNKEDDAIEILLRHISDKIRQGERNELIDELKTYREANEKQKIKINLDAGGYTTNSKPVNLIYPFCLFSFYYLFHVNQIAIINNSEFQQTEDGTHIPDPEPETTEQKIKRILEPIRGAFDTAGHLDLIVKALAENSDTGKLPQKTERKIIQVNNGDFYPYFKQVKKETRLTVPGIASVLVYFICQNNGSGNPIAPGTIEKNIKLN